MLIEALATWCGGANVVPFRAGWPKAKTETVKLYQFRDKDGGAFLEELRHCFSKDPTKFQHRWHFPVETARERKAQERKILQFGRRMLEMASFQASTVDRDLGLEIEGWAGAASAPRKRTGNFGIFPTG